MKGASMLKGFGAVLLALMVVSAWNRPAAAEETAAPAADGAKAGAPATEDEQVAYAIGHMMAKNLASSGMEFDVKQLLRGIEDTLLKREIAMTDEEIRTAITSFQEKLQVAEKAKMEADAAKNEIEGKANLEKGEAFLAENKGKDGVVTTESGLQYQVLQDGAGETPQATATVKVHYTGKLLDDTVFDSSVERGEPATFPLNRVIPGWTEGLQLMKVGAKYRFWIPAALAYGPNPDPRSGIGPNQTLTFDVELLEIASKENANGAVVIPDSASK